MSLKDDINEANRAAAKEGLAAIAETLKASGAIDASQPPAPVDPMTTGLAHLRSIDPDALRIWSVKGPKEVGGTISAVLFNGTDIVMLHQRASGRFTTFTIADLKADAE